MEITGLIEPKQRKSAQSTMRSLVFLIAAFAIILGCAARFDHLGSRLLWQDEAFSMLRITGHTEAGLYGAFDGRVKPVATFLALNKLSPHLGLGATFASLREEPQRGPVFYGAARIWAGFVGDGTPAMRVLPALLGLLGVALAFALGRELSPGGGPLLAALVALSPIEIHFAQQIREYVAIADATLLSSWLLLLSQRTGGIWRWSSYGIALVIGLYVSPIFLTVLLGHAVVVAGAARRDGLRAVIPWLATTAAAFVAFAPWFAESLLASRGHAGDLAWLHGGYTARAYATKWIFNLGAVFFDAEFARTSLGVLLAPVFAIIVIAFFGFIRRSYDMLPALLAIGLSFCVLVPLVVVDAIGGSHVQAVARYQMPTWIGIDIIVTLMLARGIAGAPRDRAIVIGTFAFLVACGAFSIASARHAPVWWDDNEHVDEQLATSVITSHPMPALVVASNADSRAPYALVLSHYLPKSTNLLLFSGEVPPPIEHSGSTYLFLPSQTELAAVRQGLDRGRLLRDVSPPLGITIQNLTERGTRDSLATIRPDNLLWLVSPEKI